MGTVASWKTPQPPPRGLVARVEQILHDADARFSPFRADSELCRMRRDPDHAPSPDMVDVLAGARLVEVVTDGRSAPPTRAGDGRRPATSRVGDATRGAGGSRGGVPQLPAVCGRRRGGRRNERGSTLARGRPAPGPDRGRGTAAGAPGRCRGHLWRLRAGRHIWGRRDEIRGAGHRGRSADRHRRCTGHGPLGCRRDAGMAWPVPAVRSPLVDGRRHQSAA